jgi:hypothetical protein
MLVCALLMGNCKGACIYPTREDLVYYPAVFNGMAPEDSSGEKNDASKYFRKVEYEYLGSKHLKGMSFKRSEFAGMKGVRLVFQMCSGFNWKGARTKEHLDEQKAMKEKLKSKCEISGASIGLSSVQSGITLHFAKVVRTVCFICCRT